MATTYTLRSHHIAHIAADEIKARGWDVRLTEEQRKGQRVYILVSEAPDSIASALTPGGLPVGRQSRHRRDVVLRCIKAEGRWL